MVTTTHLRRDRAARDGCRAGCRAAAQGRCEVATRRAAGQHDGSAVDGGCGVRCQRQCRAACCSRGRDDGRHCTSGDVCTPRSAAHDAELLVGSQRSHAHSTSKPVLQLLRTHHERRRRAGSAVLPTRGLARPPWACGPSTRACLQTVREPGIRERGPCRRSGAQQLSAGRLLAHLVAPEAGGSNCETGQRACCDRRAAHCGRTAGPWRHEALRCEAAGRCETRWIWAAPDRSDLVTRRLGTGASKQTAMQRACRREPRMAASGVVVLSGSVCPLRFGVECSTPNRARLLWPDWRKPRKSTGRSIL